jgi:predicted GNAT family acetyltransferase
MPGFARVIEAGHCGNGKRPPTSPPHEETRSPLNALTIRNNPARQRFELLDGVAAVGQAAYVDDGDGHRIFYHTVVDEELSGQGLAGRLAAQALDETVAAGLMIVPVCPYIKNYLGKHPQYAESIRKPTPALLGVLQNALAERIRR